MLDLFECVSVVDSAPVSLRVRPNVVRRHLWVLEGCDPRAGAEGDSGCPESLSVVHLGGRQGVGRRVKRTYPTRAGVSPSMALDGFLRDSVGTVARPASRCWKGREPRAGVKGGLGRLELLTVVRFGGRPGERLCGRSTPTIGEVVLGSSGCGTVKAFFERVRVFTADGVWDEVVGSPSPQSGGGRGSASDGQRTCCSGSWFRVRQHNSGGVSSPLLTSDARWGVRPVASDL
jgi:hypothetical protein